MAQTINMPRMEITLSRPNRQVFQVENKNNKIPNCPLLFSNDFFTNINIDGKRQTSYCHENQSRFTPKAFYQSLGNDSARTHISRLNKNENENEKD